VAAGLVRSIVLRGRGASDSMISAREDTCIDDGEEGTLKLLVG
jgi:hypothetical protein